MSTKIIVLALMCTLGTFAFVAYADHSWGGYHWARTANPFALQLGDNVSPAWDTYLATTSNVWSVSSVLDTVVTVGKSNVRTCKPTAGRVEVCNAKYGSNGWLGIAQVWVSGGHITQGVVKMNDTYFLAPAYNTPAWRNLVMCQEVGHTFGLAHQDENFANANLNTCMDYTSNPASNQYPNTHDYEMLESLYAHLDSVTTVLSAVATTRAGKPQGVGQDIDLSEPTSWGKEVSRDAQGKVSLYVRALENGDQVYTHVTWIQE